MSTKQQENSKNQHAAWLRKIITVFPALAHHNYQLYFSGQLISLIGTWLQLVAQGWLVLQLTDSAFMVGFIAALNTAPVLVFSLFGGVLVDRFSKRGILFATQGILLVLAVILGLLTVLNVVQVWHIAVLTLLMGIVNAIDMPARQAFAAEIVGRKDLTSAIALNSGAYNGARTIGPGIAGFLIGFFSIGGAFLLNALTFLPIMIALYFIKPQAKAPQIHARPFSAMKEGILYAYTNHSIRYLLIFATVASFFGWSYITILPVIAQRVFYMDAAGLGLLYSASGLGSVVATFVMSLYAHRISPLRFILGGSLLFVVSITLFTLTTNVPLALFLLFFSGLGIITVFATINSTIQHTVSDHIRGRIMSIYTFMFVGMGSIGNLQIGFVAEELSSLWALRISMAVIALATIVLYCYRR